MHNDIPLHAAVSAVCLVCVFSASSARAQPNTVYGGPAYDASTGNGYRGARMSSVHSVNNVGQAVGSASKYINYQPAGPDDTRAVQWDRSGNASELASLGTSGSGAVYAAAYAINDAGQAVGYSNKWSGSSSQGSRPVRWDTNGSLVELGNLGTTSGGTTTGRSVAINSSGQAAGWVEKYVSGSDKRQRAVRWSGNGAVLELPNLGTDPSGVTETEAYALNDAGQVVGYAGKYVGGVWKGERAVRWNANGAAVELQNLGVDASGVTHTYGNAINASGQVAGSAEVWSNGTLLRTAPVCWSSDGKALELPMIGLGAGVSAINNSGQMAGSATRTVAGGYFATRAVRWDSDGAVLELGTLGNPDSVEFTSLYAMNNAGLMVGYADKYDPSGMWLGTRAVCWQFDGRIVDLNTLIDPASGWLLTEAHSISDTGWIAGLGKFDPDGPGPLVAYDRLFLMQVPEPASIAFLCVGGLLWTRRSRRKRGRHSWGLKREHARIADGIALRYSIWKVLSFSLTSFVAREGQMRSLICALVFVAATVPVHAVVIGQQDTFDLGSLNWSGFPIGGMNTSGGPAGPNDGYFLALTGSSANQLFVSNQNAQWAGNYLSAGVTAIAADLRNLGSSSLEIRMLLDGPSTVASTPAFHLPADGQWYHAIFSLAPVDLTLVNDKGGGGINSVLTNALVLLFEHQAGPPASVSSSIVGSFGIDNIIALPEPMSLLMFLLPLALIRRRSS